MSNPYNEPAFPVEWPYGSGEQHPGMTLRDYFAAKALPNCVAQFPADIRRASQLAYYIADEMLTARGEKP